MSEPQTMFEKVWARHMVAEGAGGQLSGRDEIGLTLGFEAQICEFEARHAREIAWAVPPRASA